MNAQILAKLNQHPLNQAALRRLTKEGRRPSPETMHLLDLAHLGSQTPEGDLDYPTSNLLGDWGEHQGSALEALQADLKPEFVEAANLDRVAGQVLDSLRAWTGPPQES